MVKLAVVRPATTMRSLSPQELDDFEQELVDQFALAAAASGITDDHISQERSVIFAFLRFLGNYLWTAQPEDVDGSLNRERKVRGLANSTVHAKAGTLARFFVSEATIKTHLRSVLNKLELRTRLQLVAFAHERRLLGS